MSLTKVTSNVINDVDASKLTGSIVDARVPASAVTQHVTVYNDASIRSDILKLAIHQAIDGNRVAYNLEDSFIDGFEDDTGITTETTVDRDIPGEYVSTVRLGTPVYDSGDRTSSITVTSSLSLIQGSWSNLVDGATTENSSDSLYWTHAAAASGNNIKFDFGSGNIPVVSEAKWSSNGSNAQGTWKWQGSNNDSDWTDVGSSFAFGGTSLQTMTSLNGNATGYRYYRLLGESGTMIYNWQHEVNFKYANIVSDATGTLISDPQTASSSRTSCSGVIIYEDADGTNTLGTDLKLYFTANNGTNWTEAASYGTATTYSGTKKLVKLGATTVTAGTQVAMKAVWANQANGSKEARLHGWAVNY